MNKFLICFSALLLMACTEPDPITPELARRWADHRYQTFVGRKFNIPKESRDSIPVPEPIFNDYGRAFHFEYIEPKTGKKIYLIVMKKERDIVGDFVD
jgi:hypothetical protein